MTDNLTIMARFLSFLHRQAMKKRIFHTDFLTPDQDFITGAGSVFDIFDASTPYNETESGQDADVKAIANDWAVIGEDMRIAIEKHRPVEHEQ